jgi:RNA polymerase sigma-70 factor (ECF subfamily)
MASPVAITSVSRRAALGSLPEPLAEQRDLLSQLSLRQPHAWERLVREQSPRLLAVARRILRDEDAARDAVQEAFVAAFRHLERFAGQALLSTWLHRIVVNAALMRLRSRAARPETSIEDLLPAFEADGHHVVSPPAWRQTPDELLEQDEARKLVREAIDRLPEAYRTVLLLRDIEELDTATTAAILGVTVPAVKVRLHRARQALRTLLEPHFSRGSAESC